MQTNDPESLHATEKAVRVEPANNQTIQRILVALDDTALATAVARDAIALGQSEHASLCFYEALQIPPVFAPAAATHSADALPAFLRREAETRLNEFARSAGDLSTEISIDESSDPGGAILQAARRHRSDLIVIGSHKYGIVERMLGTTIAHVLASADCNVLAVRDEAPSSKGEPPFVLACLDDSPATLEVYRAAVIMARATRLPLHALRIVTGAGESPTSYRDLIAEGVKDLEEIAKNAKVGVLTRATAIVDVSVGQAICAAADAAALVVVGARRTGRLRSLGATAPYVVRHCASPVLIVRVQELARAGSA